MSGKTPFCVLRGTVIHGKGKGHKVGMPTANLLVAPGQTLPPLGVYATRVRRGDQLYIGVTNVGQRPSVDDDQTVTVETFLINFRGDLYHEEIRVEFFTRLRDIQVFRSLEKVKEQVLADGREAERFFSPAGTAAAAKEENG